ncbi:hypothetical protein [Streptomyces sp. NPDC001070]
MSRTNQAVLTGTGVICALANAVLHFLLVPDHLEEKFYIGVLFLVGSVIMLAVACGLMALHRPFAAWATGAAVSAGMIAGFALSRTVGLPGYHEEGWEAPYGPLSVTVEGVFVLAFLAWLVAGATGPAPAARIRETPGVRQLSARSR